jgi:hypothetical protein
MSPVTPIEENRFSRAVHTLQNNKNNSGWYTWVFVILHPLFGTLGEERNTDLHAHLHHQ